MCIVSLGLIASIYWMHMCMCAKLVQLCPILRDPMYCKLSGSFIMGILQAKKKTHGVGYHALLQGIFPT